MVFNVVYILAGMTRFDISEKCTVQLHWVTEYGVGVKNLEGKNVLATLKLDLKT
jgi:hypothetical protein